MAAIGDGGHLDINPRILDGTFDTTCDWLSSCHAPICFFVFSRLFVFPFLCSATAAAVLLSSGAKIQTPL